ncbi:type IV secretory system conjugative DNA transfer family protein [Patescibacteria group bacterium]
MLLLQFQAGLDEYGEMPQISRNFFNNQIFYTFFLIVIIAIIIYSIVSILKIVFHKHTEMRRNLNKALFLVRVPKKSFKEESGQQTNIAQKIQEEIVASEGIFANIGGLKAEKGLKSFFTGRRDHLSFEIVAREGEIYFYLSVPKKLKGYLEQQISAQYPDANIEEIDNYNIFKPEAKIKSASLVFGRSYIFPIKTYKKSDVDMMNAITNSLSKLDNDDGAVVQFMVRSAKKRWHKWGKEVASKMHQGKKLEQALREVTSNWFFKFIFGIIKVAKHTKTKEEDEHKKEQEQSHQLSPMENEIVKAVEEKASKAGMEVNIRIVIVSKDEKRAELYLNNITNAFSLYSVYEYGNNFKKKKIYNQDKFVKNFIYRGFDENRKLILNSEEMASLFHFPISSTETPNIKWLKSKGASAPVNMPKDGVVLGENNYRSVNTKVRIKKNDRRRHMYIVGVTGSGKSVLMGEMAKQDIKNGDGVCIIDPHGSLVENVLSGIPAERAEDVIIFDPSDVERPVGLNMLEANTPEEADFAVQEMISIFYKLVSDPNMIGPMFEHNMRNAMLTLMADKEQQGTICEIPRIFTDSAFQKYKIKKVSDPMVRSFWEKEMSKTSDFHKSEMLGYLISKVGRFIENEMIRNIIGQPKSGFNFRDVMDKKKILLVNLSKGKVGEMNSDLLGLIIVAKIQMAALSRANMPEDERNDFYLYIDEFQNYVTDSIATILAEARKYRLNLIMAHQYISQLVKNQDANVRDAVFGNAGSMVCFRIGAEDAEFMAKQFDPVFSQNDLINIDKYHAYVRLLIDNTAARAFEMASINPTPPLDSSLPYKIKQLSRLKYGKDKKIVEADMLERSNLGGN